MKTMNEIEELPVESERSSDADPLLPLVLGRATTNSLTAAFSGVVVGELVAMIDEGRTPLVVYPGQAGSAAIAARSVIDLHGAHVGKPVVLMFEGADGAKPIVMGLLRAQEARPLEQRPDHVEVDADGRRLLVTAREELVLRCGKASITLTKAGKVLIHGSYVSSRSSGVNRVKGGSVQIN
jgi:Domain of unknown function (DUF6484)